MDARELLRIERDICRKYGGQCYKCELNGTACVCGTPSDMTDEYIERAGGFISLYAKDMGDNVIAGLHEKDIDRIAERLLVKLKQYLDE